MSEPQAHILVTDDEKAIRNTLKDILEFEDYQVSLAESGDEALSFLSDNEVDLILLDIKMQGIDGIQTLSEIRKNGIDCPVIMISGHGNIEIAVEATKMGAFDFIEKPPDLNRLLISCRNALSTRNLEAENKQIRKKLPKLQPIVGESTAINKIKDMIDKVAPSQSRVLITGDNGTGKELVAKWIHEKSPRSAGPFVEINCAAIPEELLESELFGHEKGAFTGADKKRIGKFEQAKGGTLFLDEIGDMSLQSQAKVLRALQENKVTPVGGNKPVHVDVRVLSATNKDLHEEISEGNFREDLYHRVGVIPIHVPPLDERKEDIPLIAKSTLEDLKENDISFSSVHFEDSAFAALMERSWPGNVRELQNAIERIGILSAQPEITADIINDILRPVDEEEADLSGLAEQTEDFQSFKEQAEKIFILKHLRKNDWNISQTADSIGIQRSHIYNKMKKYNIER